ncbi:hypothetical protein HDZ31DRAFT_77203, partial [Schizophyllum fasciatum]
MSDSERELLSALDAHGRAFLAAFDMPPSISHAEAKDVNRKRNRAQEDVNEGRGDDAGETADDKEWEEWHGFGGSDGGNGDDSGEDEGEDGDGEEYDSDLNDDEFTSAQPTVITFTDPSASASAPIRAPSKAFMSSKVSKLRSSSSSSSTSRPTPATAEDAAEASNAQNDALLHRLVHTQLLDAASPHSTTTTTARTPSRRTALLGRLHELAAAGARPGSGARAVQAAERAQHARGVREGLERARRAAAARRAAEARELGVPQLLYSGAYSASRILPPAVTGAVVHSTCDLLDARSTFWTFSTRPLAHPAPTRPTTTPPPMNHAPLVRALAEPPPPGPAPRARAAAGPCLLARLPSAALLARDAAQHIERTHGMARLVSDAMAEEHAVEGGEEPPPADEEAPPADAEAPPADEDAPPADEDAASPSPPARSPIAALRALLRLRTGSNAAAQKPGSNASTSNASASNASTSNAAASNAAAHKPGSNTHAPTNRAPEPFEVLRAIERRDEMYLMDVRDRAFH